MGLHIGYKCKCQQNLATLTSSSTNKRENTLYCVKPETAGELAEFTGARSTERERKLKMAKLFYFAALMALN